MVKFKQMVILCVLVFCCGNMFAENTISEPSQSPAAQYGLFKTSETDIFIKLDTVTGKMWLIRLHSGDNPVSTEINIRDLAAGKQKTPGRFTLLPIEDRYKFIFILIDQFEGNTWSVELSGEKANWLVLPAE